MKVRVSYAQRVESLLLALEQVALEYVQESGGEAKRIDIVDTLGLHQPCYPALNQRRLVEKSWVAQTILSRLEQKGEIVQSKDGSRTVVRIA